MDFLDIDEDVPLGALGKIHFQLFDLRAFASDDDAGPGGANGDPQLVAGAIHFDGADTGRLQPLAQRLAQFHIFLQQLRVVLLGEPAGTPRLVKAQPETVRMYFLSHTKNPFSRRYTQMNADQTKRGQACVCICVHRRTSAVPFTLSPPSPTL